MVREFADVYREAKEAFEQGDYSKAEPLIKELMGGGPPRADFHNKLGVIYRYREFFEQAIEEFKQALKINPNYTEAQLNLAITYSDMGAYDLAAQEYRKAVEREKSAHELPSITRTKLGNAHVSLAQTYGDLGLYDQAIEELKKGLALCPNFADYHHKLGIIYKEKSMFAEAEKEFSEALRINPKYVDVMNNLGLLYFKQGKAEQAMSQWQRALEINPKNNTARIYMRLLKK